METTRDLKAPIFGLLVINDYLIVASGGGGSKFGVKNKLMAYKVTSTGLSEAVCEKEVEEIPVFIAGISAKRLFCVSMSNESHFYSINHQGQFDEVNRVKTLPVKSEEVFQSVGQMSSDGEYFGCGTNTGLIKVYTMKLKQNVIDSIEMQKEANVHVRAINNIIILAEKKIAFTASGDGSCKMLELSTLKQLAKITFRQTLNEPANYFMRNIIYDAYYNVVYTLQSPLRGKTFITKWDLSQNLKPMASLEVNDDVCLSFSYSPEMKVIGVTDSKGHIIYVNPKEMSIISKQKVGENEITSGQFFGKHFITGSIDSIVSMHKAKGTSFGLCSLLIKLLILGLFVYYIYLKRA